jgi:hypothetical protein
MQDVRGEELWHSLMVSHPECGSVDDYYFWQLVASCQLVLHARVIIPFSQFARDFIYLFIFFLSLGCEVSPEK